MHASSYTAHNLGTTRIHQISYWDISTLKKAPKEENCLNKVRRNPVGLEVQISNL